MIQNRPTYHYWRLNGTAYNHLPSDVRNDTDLDQETVGDSEKYILTILGRAKYNGTKVQCVAGIDGGERESENATLLIQGINCSCMH